MKYTKKKPSFLDFENNWLRTDRPTDGPTDGRTDRPSYRDARTHLKKEIATKTTNYNYFKACTAHSFACAALFASLTRSAALICSLAHSLTHSEADGRVFFVYRMSASISYHLNPLCHGAAVAPSFVAFSSQ